jgi:predicted Fe-Mo cluster-binding NifX family protein
MKIAAACEGEQIFGHFGHCETFQIFEAENGTITAQSRIPNPGHKPGFLPNFLADQGVNVMIAGSMGGGAAEIFRERGVEVITGAEGDARAAAEAYLQGRLKSTGVLCREHAQEETCGKCHKQQE